MLDLNLICCAPCLRTDCLSGLCSQNSRPVPRTALRHHRREHCLHLLHLVVIVHHDDTARKHDEGEHPTGCTERSGQTPAFSRLHLVLFHFFSEITDHSVPRLALNPPCVFSRNHVVLHHLIFFVVNVVSPQFIKSVLRGSIHCFLPLKSAVDIHQLILSGEIRPMLFPIVERAEHRSGSTAEKPSKDDPSRKHLLHISICLFPEFFRKFYFFSSDGRALYLECPIHKQIGNSVLLPIFAQQKSDPQILSAGRVETPQICIYIVFDIKL